MAMLAVAGHIERRLCWMLDRGAASMIIVNCCLLCTSCVGDRMTDDRISTVRLVFGYPHAYNIKT